MYRGLCGESRLAVVNCGKGSSSCLSQMYLIIRMAGVQASKVQKAPTAAWI